MTRRSGLPALIAILVLAAPAPALAVSADAGVTMTDSPDPAREQGNVTYTITAANNGPSPASVRVELPLPAGLTFVSASLSQGSVSLLAGNTLRYDFGSIANGASATANAVYSRDHPGTSTATATASLPTVGDTDPNAANNSASQSTTFRGLTAAPIAFGDQFLGTLSPGRTVTITNFATTPVTLNPLTATGAAPSDFLNFGDTCSAATLAVDASCVVTLRFAPGALGNRSETLNAAPTAGAVDPLPLSISGRGVPLPTNQGPPGPAAFKLVIATAQGRLGATVGRRVTVAYASTLRASVRLDVLKGRKRIASVRRRARVGGNTISWNGRRRGKSVQPGRYRLRLTARNGTQTATAAVRLRIRPRGR